MEETNCKCQFSDKLIAKSQFLVRQLGTYHFQSYLSDKLIDLNILINQYRALPQEDRVQVAKDLHSHYYSCQMLGVILDNMGHTISDQELKEIVKAGHITLQNNYLFDEDESDEMSNVLPLRSKEKEKPASTDAPFRIYKI